MNLKSIPYCSWGTQCDWPIKKEVDSFNPNAINFFFCSENQNKASSLHHCLELHLKNHMPLWDRTVIIVLILYGPILWLNNSANGIPDFPFLSVSPSLPPHSSIVLSFSTGLTLRLWLIQMGQYGHFGLFNLDSLTRSPVGQSKARALFNFCQLTCEDWPNIHVNFGSIHFQSK